MIRWTAVRWSSGARLTGMLAAVALCVASLVLAVAVVSVAVGLALSAAWGERTPQIVGPVPAGTWSGAPAVAGFAVAVGV